MKYTFFVDKERASYLRKAQLKVRVIGQGNNDCLEVELEINDGYDLLRLLHAGIDYGMDFMGENKRRVAA